MSHGPSNDETVEPNLTALLDLVLQILFFFIVTVQISNEREKIRRDVELPISETALPKSKDDAISLNFLKRPLEPDKPDVHYAEAIGVPRMTDMQEIRRFLNTTFNRIRDRDNQQKAEATAVELRIAAAAEYKYIFQLMQACSDAGFKNLKVALYRQHE